MRTSCLVVKVDSKVVGLNIHWLDVSDASYNIAIHEKNENKGSQIGHTKKKKKKYLNKPFDHNVNLT